MPTHNPDKIEEILNNTSCNVALAGDTLGGEIKIPFSKESLIIINIIKNTIKLIILNYTFQQDLEIQSICVYLISQVLFIRLNKILRPYVLYFFNF